MQLLKDRIRSEGKVLPGNIIKVDGFLNHRIDTELMDHIAEEFGKHFNMDEVTVILTAEASGIALSAIVARLCGAPGGHIRRRQRSRTEELSLPPAGGPPVLCGGKKIARPARCVRCRARNATCQRDGKMVY